MQVVTNPHRQHYLALNARRTDWSGVLIVVALLAAFTAAFWLLSPITP